MTVVEDRQNSHDRICSFGAVDHSDWCRCFPQPLAPVSTSSIDDPSDVTGMPQTAFRISPPHSRRGRLQRQCEQAYLPGNNGEGRVHSLHPVLQSLHSPDLRVGDRALPRRSSDLTPRKGDVDSVPSQCSRKLHSVLSNIHDRRALRAWGTGCQTVEETNSSNSHTRFPLDIRSPRRTGRTCELPWSIRFPLHSMIMHVSRRRHNEPYARQRLAQSDLEAAAYLPIMKWPIPNFRLSKSPWVHEVTV